MQTVDLHRQAAEAMRRHGGNLTPRMMIPVAGGVLMSSVITGQRLDMMGEEVSSQVKDAVGKLNKPIRLPKVGRNVPCPCGSGRKFKRCCHDRRAGINAR